MNDLAEPTAPQTDAHSGADDAQVRDYWRLMKPRVMSLVIFTALVGMIVAPQGPHPLIGAAALLCIALGAGASGALNMWWDADIDRRMARTRNRPIPQGRVEAEDALFFGAGLSLLSVLLLTLIANPLSGALLALTIGYYLFIYTIWLKRRTPQNIVIGGAAGAFPPLIGWTVAMGGVALEPLLLFAIILLWTPPHSWALALFRGRDYAEVGVPMLPVAAGEPETRRQILLYSIALALVAMAPVATPIAGPFYALVATLFSLRFVRLAWALKRRDATQAEADDYGAEKKFFGFSILYLFALFLALLVETVLPRELLGLI